MFDFEHDKIDSRYAPENENAAAPTTAMPAVPVTRQSDPPVIIPAAVIPAPPPMPAPVRPSGRKQPRPTKQRRSRGWILWLAAGGVMVFVMAGILVALAVLIDAERQKNATPTASAQVVAALPTPVDARTAQQPTMTLAGQPTAIRTGQPTAALITGQPTAITTLQAGQELTLDDGSRIVLTPWDGTSRLNILLMGIDRRPGETGLAYRSDTMMLVSLDQKTKQIGILSIPRDLYVSIPGYSAPQRINTALPLGEQQRAGFGPKLAMQTVQYNFGMGVNAYVVADFSALIKVVDALGGIDVDVPTAITDNYFPDMAYGFDPLILSAGLQHMDGETAQKYARTRHGNSDFDRAQRQQQVLFAIRDRILSLNSLPQLVIQAPSLYASLNQNINTELTVQQIISLGMWLKDIPAENIHTGVMDQHYVQDYITPDGADVLVPYDGALPRLLAEVFGSDYGQQ